MPKLPKQTLIKELPVENIQDKEIPAETKPVNNIPNVSSIKEETPQESPIKEETPQQTPEKEEMPPENKDDNCVEINGQKIEIKPTKLKYFRNKTASVYNLLKAYPLSELLALGKGVIDERRDGDQVVYEFLIAAFDNAEFVKDHYNEFDADQVEKVIRIFGRLNHIDEKVEAQRKNREAQANR